MKKLFLAATVALAFFASCSQDTNSLTDPIKGSVVNVSFVDEPSESRAFFATTAAAETWEKTLSSVTMFIFNPSGNLITQRAFNASEIAGKSASFALPDVSPGTNCDFYAVANLSTITGITTKAALLAVLENNAGQYNGTFAEVSTGAKRTDGFVMSGTASKAVAAAGSTTTVALTLKRTVAKIAVQVTQSAGFGSIYSGAVRVNSVSIGKAATQSPVVKPATPTTGTMNYTFSQNSNVSGADYQNLFYVFENGTLAAGSRVTLTIDAIYDADGNFSTTTDQVPMSYTVELDGDAAGAIARNGYYRVSVTINGLSGSDASMTFTVADWETPVTQTVNIGM